jgi:hypothetical protein
LIALTDEANIKSLKANKTKQIMDASRTHLRVYFSDGGKKDIQISAGEKPEKLTKLYTYWTKTKTEMGKDKIILIIFQLPL